MKTKTGIKKKGRTLRQTKKTDIKAPNYRLVKNQEKKSGKMSAKTASTPHKASKTYKKHIRNQEGRGAVSLNLERLKINLGHLVSKLAVGGKVQAYELLAARLSTLAGLNGHSWSWNYIQQIHSGSIPPSKKFLRVFALYQQDIKPNQKQWFYFSRRRSIASIYDKSMLAEIIRTQFAGMGYKPITHARFVAIKKAATHKTKRSSRNAKT